MGANHLADDRTGIKLQSIGIAGACRYRCILSDLFHVVICTESIALERSGAACRGRVAHRRPDREIMHSILSRYCGAECLRVRAAHGKLAPINKV